MPITKAIFLIFFGLFIGVYPQVTYNETSYVRTMG